MTKVKSILLPTVSRFFEDDWNKVFDWSNQSKLNNFSKVPQVNLEELDDHFLVQMAVPGMDKENFKIELAKNTLTIKCEVSIQDSSHSKNFLYKEFELNSFERSFSLNNHLIDEEKIEAQYLNGILSIKIKKSERAIDKPSREILIK
jgi:HSP20 family protein